MELNVDKDLALLDPARGREPSAEEWIRARAAVERIVAGQVASAPARPARRRRLALVGAVAAVAAGAAVAVPALLPGSAEEAFAGWTAEPVGLTGSQVLPLAQRCAAGWGGGTATPADVIIAERRGAATLLVMRRGAGSIECMSLDSKIAGAMMPLLDGPPPPLPQGRATIETMSAYESGGSEYSNVVGLVGPGVTGVDVVLPDGEVVRTSVRDGYWAAWWPGPEGGEIDMIQVVVHTPAGDSTFQAGQLFPGR